MTDANVAANSDQGQTRQDDASVAAVSQSATPPAQDAAPAATVAAPAANATGSDDPAPSAKPQDDWRVKLAGGDEKELKRLSRFASEQDVYKAYRELENKLRSGQMRMAAPGADATPEEVSAWRKENGIPETHEAYDLTFGDGTVVGEEDKPYIDQFLKSMHGHNATPEQVKAAIKSYYEIQAVQQQQIAERDTQFRDESEALLRDEWSGDFKKNMHAINNILESMPAETREFFENSRLPDGRLLGNDPNVLRWLAGVAFELNPAASIMPSSLAAPGMAIDDEISSIEKMIGNRDSDYWKGPKAQQTQARYAQLLEVREKIKQKG